MSGILSQDIACIDGSIQRFNAAARKLELASKTHIAYPFDRGTILIVDGFCMLENIRSVDTDGINILLLPDATHSVLRVAGSVRLGMCSLTRIRVASRLDQCNIKSARCAIWLDAPNIRQECGCAWLLPKSR